MAQDGPPIQAANTPSTAGLTAMSSQVSQSQEMTASTSELPGDDIIRDIPSASTNTLLTDPTSSLSIGAGLPSLLKN